MKKKKFVPTTEPILDYSKPDIVSEEAVEKVAEELFNVEQFCSIKGVGALDRQVAIKIFGVKALKSLKKWEKEFDVKEIPHKLID